MGQQLAVTGLGMISSVGSSAISACAAIRAGVTRPGPLFSAKVLRLDTHEEVYVTGYPVSLVGNGFENAGKWLQLAPRAIEDLCVSANLPAGQNEAFWSRTKMTIVTPFLNEARFFPDEVCTVGQIEQGFVSPLRHAIRAVCSPGEVQVLSRGRCGAQEVLLSAQNDLCDGRWDRSIILAVDSLVDGPALEYAGALNQIACDSNAVGFFPGEAAACLMVECQTTSRRRNAVPAAYIASVALANEENSFLEGKSSQGLGLANAIHSCLSESSVFRGSLIADLNGELWRALEYGHAQTRSPSVDWNAVREMYYCTSVGEVGAAAGAMGLVIGARALQRGYASRAGALLLNSDEAGSVSACLLVGEANG